MLLTAESKRIFYKYRLSIKKLMANELRQEIGGGTLAGRERILGNSDGIKGSPGRDPEGDAEEDTAGTEGEITDKW